MKPETQPTSEICSEGPPRVRRPARLPYLTILLGSALLAAADGCGPSGKSLARGLALLFIPARAAVAYGGRFISVGKFGAFASDTGSKI